MLAPVDVLLLGKYGAGKSTIGRHLMMHCGLIHFDAGARLRAFAKTDGAEAAQIASLMRRGELVPVQFTVGVLADAFDKCPHSRFVIDGTPRSSAQCEAFIECINRRGRCVLPILLDVSDATSISRQVGRGEWPARTAVESSDAATDASSPNEMRTRPKDHEAEAAALARKRVAVYHKETEEVVSFFRKRGLHTINAERCIEEVTEEVTRFIRRPNLRATSVPADICLG